VRGAAAVAAVALVLAACGPGADPAPDAPPPPADAAATGGTPGASTPPPPTLPASPAPARPDDPLRTPDPDPPPCADARGCYGPPRRVGEFDVAAVPEASGLAASRRNPDVLYLLDDRPGTSEVWAIGTDGAMLGAIGVTGLDARDTEALAVGPCAAGDAAMCVYVGDIGDNLRSRDAVTVHRFAEPDLAGAVPESVVADRARLTYPDGAHDAEALFLDDAGSLYIVTKAPFDSERVETGAARLYRAAAFADGELEDLGILPVPEPEAPLQSRLVGNVVTGGDYLAGQVLLRTYDQVLEYTAPSPDADVATLPAWPVRALPAPFEPQSEAIAWAPDGCGFYTAGEIVGDLWFVPCEP
jgi:hypothetical protein